MSKKQTCASHSAPEAELVAAAAALRMEGLPALDMREGIFQHPVKLALFEDNQTATAAMTSEKNPNMQHAGRTHCVSPGWLHKVVTEDPQYVNIVDCRIKDRASDLMTKQFADASKLRATIKLGGLVDRTPTLIAQAARGRC